MVRDQYEKKFGRFGEAVVASNMQVMTQGFEKVREVPYGPLDAPDRSSMGGLPLLPEDCPGGIRGIPLPPGQEARPPFAQVATFDREFRAGYGYHQPATALSSVGIMAAATGDTASKYVARRETPLFLPGNCTQCMECISVCPDTALPNTAQPIGTVLRTAAKHYVKNPEEREKLSAALPGIEAKVRERMKAAAAAKRTVPFSQIVREAVNGGYGLGNEAKEQFFAILDRLPIAYEKANAIFATPEKRSPGAGGVFLIMVSDLCKGCAACVDACGDHRALRMEVESEELNARHETGTAFLRLLPETSEAYLGLYNGERPRDSRVAALRNHLTRKKLADCSEGPRDKPPATRGDTRRGPAPSSVGWRSRRRRAPARGAGIGRTARTNRATGRVCEDEPRGAPGDP